MRVALAKEVKAADQYTISSGISSLALMEKAGRYIADHLLQELQKNNPTELWIFAGKGNNGGDALVLARYLFSYGWKKIKVVLCAQESELTSETYTNWQKLKKLSIACQIAGKKELKVLAGNISPASWTVDGLLGIGFKGRLCSPYIEAVRCIQRGQRILSIDIPSGIEADTGIAKGIAVTADITYTIGFVKLGLLIPPGIDYAGRVIPIDIGLRENPKSKITGSRWLLTHAHVPNIPKRKVDCHKGDFGYLAILGGSPGMTGAPALTGLAALRAGTGKVRIAIDSKSNAVLEKKVLEIMTQPLEEKRDKDQIRNLDQQCTAWVIGPGLSTVSLSQERLSFILKITPHPLLLDADALNIIAKHPMLFKYIPENSIITPHPGEMARLIAKNTSYAQQHREEVALHLAKKYKIFVVLKGARTILATPDQKVFYNSTGNAGMASAGMGDVLSGIIGGLLAQGFSPLKAAQLGIFLHGLAGDLAYDDGANGPVVLARDVIQCLGNAITFGLKSKFRQKS